MKIVQIWVEIMDADWGSLGTVSQGARTLLLGLIGLALRGVKALVEPEISCLTAPAWRVSCCHLR
jgi:hypothetical protein